jgi:hypothetical protein
MESLTRVQNYVQDQFEEEFRLVVHEAGLQKRSHSGKVPVPHSYTGLCSVNYRSTDSAGQSPKQDYI